MCGIYCSNFPYSDNIIEKKMSSIDFRGPDYTGIIKVNNVILGHNRLAIIDLDKRSNQPFSYNHIKIVFNGEIYNYKELRSLLKKKGYSFNTKSDTEVLAALYIEYGEECLKFLNGMFAFTIYDEKNQTLFIARDRLGQKPLHYMINGRNIEIASQIKQIELGNNLTINDTAVNAFFKYKYIPEPYSIYNEIKKLPAGHWGKFDLKSGSFVLNKYWTISNNIENYNLDYEEAKAQLKTLLKSAVNYRLISDVPLGVFLSGGIDSSLIASLAQNSSSKKINTFCVKFDSPKHDESDHAQQIATHLGTNHTTIPCSLKEVSNLIQTLPDSFDEPFSDASAIPSLLLSKVTKKYVTVALSGDGGDESFLGYNRYDYINKYENIFKLPLATRKLVAQLMKSTGIKKFNLISSILEEPDIGRFYHRMIQPINQSYFDGNSSQSLFNHSEYLESSKNSLENIGLFDLKTYLPDDINVKIDRATMRFSLEARAPFLDYRVVEFANRLPLGFRYQKGNKKKILKDILYDFVPKQMMDRPKKGFTMPLDIWFRTNLKEWVMDNLTDKNLALIPNINVPIVKTLIEDHMKGKSNRHNMIWKLLVYHMWLNRDKK